MLTATRERSRYARYPCVVTSHFCLLWQPVTSRVSSLCLHSWCTITDRIRFVRSPLKSIVDPIRLFVSSVSIAIPERGHVLIKRTISKVCSAFNYSLWAIKDIRIRKRDYRARGQYFCWQTRSIQREDDIDGFIYVSSRAYSATLTSKSSEITFKREHCHDRGTFPAISQLLNEAPRL